MGIRPLQIVYSFSAEIDFTRQNLTSMCKVGPRAESVNEAGHTLVTIVKVKTTKCHQMS